MPPLQSSRPPKLSNLRVKATSVGLDLSDVVGCRVMVRAAQTWCSVGDRRCRYLRALRKPVYGPAHYPAFTLSTATEKSGLAVR